MIDYFMIVLLIVLGPTLLVLALGATVFIDLHRESRSKDEQAKTTRKPE
jgi:hypothetical protein